MCSKKPGHILWCCCSLISLNYDKYIQLIPERRANVINFRWENIKLCVKVIFIVVIKYFYIFMGPKLLTSLKILIRDMICYETNTNILFLVCVNWITISISVFTICFIIFAWITLINFGCFSYKFIYSFKWIKTWHRKFIEVQIIQYTFIMLTATEV